MIYKNQDLDLKIKITHKLLINCIYLLKMTGLLLKRIIKINYKWKMIGICEIFVNYSIDQLIINLYETIFYLLFFIQCSYFLV